MAEDLDQAILKKTADILSGVIKKPVITEKNLKRPPFRFLHDIITSIIKSTGFLKGLYTAEEMVSDNVKEKELKMAFLQKAIDALSIVTNQTINLRPSKVIAGHEVQKTNEFLQILGTSVRKKLDSREAVQIVLGKSSGDTPSQKDRRASVDKRPKNASEKTRSSTKTNDSNVRKSDASKTKDSEKVRSHSKDSKTRDKEKAKEKSRSKRDDSKSRDKSESKKEKKHRKERKVEESPSKGDPIENNHVPNGHIEDVFPIENEGFIETESQMVNGESLMDANFPLDNLIDTKIGNNEDMSPLKVSTPVRTPSGHRSRPPSARSNRKKSGHGDTRSEEHIESNMLKPMDIHAMAPSPMPRPPSARPSSARPSSSRPAPPRIRIRHIVENDEPSIRPITAKPVENVIVDQGHQSDEEEEEFFVTEEPTVDLQPPEPSYPVSDPTPDEDKGSLVKTLLETKKDLEGGSQQMKKTEIDISQMTSASLQRAREASSREIEQLRQFIQTVSKSANPLGRMLDYFQEDVDAMKAELKMWKEEHKQNLAALRREKSVTETTLEPLTVQLDDLDQVVQDQIDANSALKSSILRNEERIQRMLAGLRRQRS